MNSEFLTNLDKRILAIRCTNALISATTVTVLIRPVHVLRAIAIRQEALLIARFTVVHLLGGVRL